MSKSIYTSVDKMVEDFVQKYADSTRLPQSAHTWGDVVGEKLSAHCKLIDIKQESIIIEVEHPAIAQELRFSKETILAKVQAFYPELNITTIKTVIKKNYDQPLIARPKTKPSVAPSQPQATIPDEPAPKKDAPREIRSILERIQPCD